MNSYTQVSILPLLQQQDMTALLEKQIEELQKENASIAGALKDSSALREWNCITYITCDIEYCHTVERQTDSYEQTKSNNASLHEQLTAAKNHIEALSVELAEKGDELAQLEKKHQQQEETHSKKVYK